MSCQVIWFEMEFKNQNFCPRAHWRLYVGEEVENLAGCVNPIILPDLRFTLEMATFELVTQHIAWIFIFNILPHSLVLRKQHQNSFVNICCTEVH